MYKNHYTKEEEDKLGVVVSCVVSDVLIMYNHLIKADWPSVEYDRGSS